jgi:asparagine synthetase B (glutamine-hydrolysing)
MVQELCRREADHLGAIAAVFSESPVDAPRLVAKMLLAMQHRAQDAAAVACGDTIEFAKSPTQLIASSPNRYSAIGYCFTRILPIDVPQPIRAGGTWFAIEGRILEGGEFIGGEQAARVLESKLTQTGFPSISRYTDGAYAICCCTDEWLRVTRDQLGLKPIYLGHQGNLTAVASDRKALWAIGFRDGTIFPPGGSLTATDRGMTISDPSPQSEATERTPHAEVDAARLANLLVESVTSHTTGLGPVACGFSGGIDSTVLAKIAKDLGVDLLLVTVGIGRTAEMVLAESTARPLELPIVMKEFSKEEVGECLDHVLWLVEEPSLMKISIAMAMRWIAQVASQNGRNVVILGQGSDELFGGYKRFARILGKDGRAVASKAISESIQDAYEVNYQRDEQAVSEFCTEIRLPFATRKIIEFAEKVPLEMKVRGPSDNLRKWILRDAAIKIGIPSEIALRSKKAIQHGSGIEKAIREIARKNHLSPSVYLEQRLHSMKRDLAP